MKGRWTKAGVRHKQVRWYWIVVSGDPVPATLYLDDDNDVRVWMPTASAEVSCWDGKVAMANARRWSEPIEVPK